MANVVYQAAVRDKLTRWGAVAVLIGMRDSFLAAIRAIEERLRADPEEWGDPVRDFRGLRLTMYHHYGPLLIVKYAVHIDGTPVFVMDVQLTPGTLLADAIGEG